MKLYIYDHCPYCVKARMIFGLKNIPVEEIILLNDDEATPIEMIGQKMLPILAFDDGRCMPESIDIVQYIDGFDQKSVLVGQPRREIAQWLEETYSITSALQMPRNILYPFAEFKTQAARDYYQQKKEAYYGDFNQLIADTQLYIQQLKPFMQQLNDLIVSTNAVNGLLSWDDIHLFARLRILTIVKEVDFPDQVLAYLETMAKMSNVPLLFD